MVDLKKLTEYKTNFNGSVTDDGLLGEDTVPGGLASSVISAAPVPVTKAFDWRNPTGGFVSEEFKSTSPSSLSVVGTENPESSDWGFGVDGESLQGYAQLGGLAMQLLGYSDKKKHMKAQTAGLKQNIAQQATDNAFKASTIANLGGATKPIKAQTGMA